VIDLDLAEALSHRGWIDITRPLTPATPVWPGDEPFAVHTAEEKGCVLSWFSTTCHAGTHLEAPMHLEPGAAAVDEVALGRLIGPAEVVLATPAGLRIDRRALPAGWAPRASRILVRSDGHPLQQPVGESFAGLDVDLVEWLADQQVELIGVDTPSVDPFSATGFEAHRALARRGVTWIEGLWLGDANAGLYLLLALPLRLAGTEAAPLRALLRPLGKEGALA